MADYTPSIVQLCNQALAEIGTRSSITSLTDGSTEAFYCNLWYDTIRQNLLRTAQWGFARYQIYLDQIGDLYPDNTSPYPWLFEYAYPVDCIKVRYVLPPPPPVVVGNIPVGGTVIGPTWLHPSRSNRFIIASDVANAGAVGEPVWYADVVNNIFMLNGNATTQTALYDPNTGNATTLTLETLSALFADNYLGICVNYPAGSPIGPSFSTNNSSPPDYSDFVLLVNPISGAIGDFVYDDVGQGFTGSAVNPNSLDAVYTQDGVGNSTLSVTINGVLAGNTTGGEPTITSTPQTNVGLGWTSLGFYSSTGNICQPPGTPEQIKVILTNVANAIGVYTKDITNPAIFDSLFQTALTNALAYKLVLPLSGNAGMREQFRQTAELAIAQARAADGENIAKNDFVPDWIRARGIGSPFGANVWGDGFDWGQWWGGYEDFNWGA